MATETTSGRQRRHCSKRMSRLEPAANAMGWKRSGWDSQMLRVLWPMEPVEPRTAIFFTLLILVPRGRQGLDLGWVRST